MEEQPIFRFGATSDAHSIGSTLPKKQGSKFHLHVLDTVKVFHKLEKVLLSKSTSISNDQQ